MLEVLWMFRVRCLDPVMVVTNPSVERMCIGPKHLIDAEACC